MPYAELSSVNTSEGIHTLLVYVNDVTSGLFVGLLLLSFFMVSLFASYYAQIASGNRDFAGSFAVAGFLTAVLSFMLMTIDGIASDTMVLYSALSVTVAIIGVFFLMSDRSGQ